MEARKLVEGVNQPAFAGPSPLNFSKQLFLAPASAHHDGMLDGHDYLLKQGWKGKGNALKSGGIAKPIAVTQKRTLSVLGKDRYEAFPFWEHL